MNASVLVALLLGALALVTILAVVALVLRALPIPALRFDWLPRLWSAGERRKLHAKERLLAQADELIAREQWPETFSTLRAAFFLEPIKRDISLVERMVSHHLNVLGRIVEFTGRHSSRISNLPVVEDLLLNRAQLLRSHFEVRHSKRSVHKRTREKGREAPEWVEAEYRRKLREIDERIAVNRRSLESQLDRLFAELEQVQHAGSNVTYH